MELSSESIKTRLASAINELSDGIEIENHQLLSCRESVNCNLSKQKIELIELTENIEAAESNYDAIKQQWDRMKSMHMSAEGNNSAVMLNKSQSTLGVSSCSLLMDAVESKQQVFVEEKDESSQVQIALTPRSEQIVHNVKVVPSLDMHNAISLDSIKTNVKRSKRSLKLKKKPQTSDDAIKTKLYTVPPRKKKMTGRLKNSNSKSTIATRETIFSDKKRFIKKSFDVFQAPQLKRRASTVKARAEPKPKALKTRHSKNLESMSLVSSRQPKSRPVASPLVNPFYHDDTVKIVGDQGDASNTIEQSTVAEQYDAEEKVEDIRKQVLNNKQSDSPIRVINKEPIAELYEPFSQRNYEMPTMSSKNKRVHRSLYHRFHIRNIPFVVGTSISPSHNLGLNIQQVLGIIKVKQPTVPGISSLLIQKVRTGSRPVSTLFEQINNEFARSCRNLSIQAGGNPNLKNRLESHQSIKSFSYEQLKPNNSMGQAHFTKPSLLCEPLYEEDEESQSTSSDSPEKNQILRRHSDKRLTLSRKQSHRMVLAEDTTTGSPTGFTKFNYASNSKEMTEVFTRLYKQFEKMIAQQDRLKDQLERRKDNKALAAEVAEMEASIKAKQKEIAAVVNLYKEVMSLKQQMKQIHERNSFVCISSDEPGFQVQGSQSRTAASFGSRWQISPTPNALRLTGLLRQMQAFQRQLKYT